MSQGLPEHTPERERLIAHRLLDLLSIADGATGDVEPAALEVLKAELSELGAVCLMYDDEDPEGTRHAEITPLIRATVKLLQLLIGTMAADAGADQLAVINTVRSVMDEVEL